MGDTEGSQARVPGRFGATAGASTWQEPGRHADRSRIAWYILYHHSVGANIHPITDLDRAKNLCAAANVNLVSNLGSIRIIGVAYRHPLVHTAVCPNAPRRDNGA